MDGGIITTLTTKRQNLYALAVLGGYLGPPHFCSDTCDNLVEYYSVLGGHMWCHFHTEIQDIKAMHIPQLDYCSHPKDEENNCWQACPFKEEINDNPQPCWCCNDCRGDCADDI